MLNLMLKIASKNDQLWKKYFDEDFSLEGNLMNPKTKSLIKRLRKTKNELGWKENYKRIFFVDKEEKIYNKYKGVKRASTPFKKDNVEICFEPFFEYEKQNRFFELNFKNYFRLLKLLFFTPEWFVFFMSHKQEIETDWSINNHKNVDKTIRRRMGILFFINFFIFSLIPIIICFIYLKFGIFKFISPLEEYSISHFLIVESVEAPLFFSGFFISSNFPLFKDRRFSFLTYIVCKKIFSIFSIFYFFLFS